MRLILQRVSSASVRVDGETVAAIGHGLMILAGVEHGDGESQVAAAAGKVARLRIFEDERGRMGRSLIDVGGEVLLVSQFTLAASLAKGRRPSFDGAARPEIAEPLIDRLAAELKGHGAGVATGRFGAHMEVELVNDGPVTFVVDLPPDSIAGGE